MDPQAFVVDLLARTDDMRSGIDIDGAELARILRILAELEISEGGPYALRPGGPEREADIGLNVAVACFLAACDVRLPKLDAFIEDALNRDARASRLFSDGVLLSLVAEYRAFAGRDAKDAPLGAPVFDEAEGRVMERIRMKARERFNALPEMFASSAHDVIERTIAGNPDKQMSLMPHYMRAALGKKGKKFGDDHIAELGLANIFFWSAFIIYDDFWDEDEAADPRLLPVANMFARQYSDFFTALLSKKSGFRAFFHSLMDKLDAANAWETEYCRMDMENGICVIPDTLPAYDDEYGIKFYPAAGHVLGPVAMLAEIGHAAESDEANALIEYFKHYLIAMQLNDDAHDWKEDLSRGHISAAVFLLLQKWRVEYPGRNEIHLAHDMSALEQLFWFEALAPLCATVLSHADQSRQALRSLGSVENHEPLEQCIVRNETIAREALRERKKSGDFLNAI